MIGAVVLSFLMQTMVLPSVPITVAVIDTGISATHVAFAHTDIAYYDPTIHYSNEGTDDICLHGTAVAGLVVAQNPEVDLLIIKATYRCGGDYTAIKDGIHYAVEHGAKVISISMAGEYDWPLLHQEIADARTMGVLVVVAAGNYGDDGIPRYPAWYDEVVAVNAYDYTPSSVGDFVDLSAPGNRVLAPLSDRSAYQYFGGTSASAPIVAGMASYIWSQQPELSLAEMENILYSSLIDIDPLGKDSQTGFGRVDERKLHSLMGAKYLSIPLLDTGGIRQPVLQDSARVLRGIEIIWQNR